MGAKFVHQNKISEIKVLKMWQKVVPNFQLYSNSRPEWKNYRVPIVTISSVFITSTILSQLRTHNFYYKCCNYTIFGQRIFFCFDYDQICHFCSTVSVQLSKSIINSLSGTWKGLLNHEIIYFQFFEVLFQGNNLPHYPGSRVIFHRINDLLLHCLPL